MTFVANMLQPKRKKPLVSQIATRKHNDPRKGVHHKLWARP